MDRWKNITLWSLGIITLIFTCSFGENKYRKVKIKSLEIDIDCSQKQYFVRQKEIRKIIRKEYPHFDSLHLREINTNLLEEKLDNYPFVKEAEVFSTLDGILKIKIAQKVPLARFMDSDSIYYLDMKGNSMPLSSNFSACVPLITGYISSDRTEIFQFINNLRKDEFYYNFFEGIEMDAKGEWILYPKPGHHKIFIGNPEDIKGKLKRLKIFYQSVVNAKNIDSLKTINLKYKGQVICKKY